ncbi:unnamed protein product [Paramecium sonneborni]|uniref:Uncharacterized protein n=1 Tax=Paramecium sonneborni TaxID=65129 RepID=A0A8S1QZM2_9CILI|nr:unnamed protein product [Paramecium sonneborni]
MELKMKQKPELSQFEANQKYVYLIKAFDNFVFIICKYLK